MDAFELWCYLRKLKLFWTMHTINEQVTNRMHTAKIARCNKNKKEWIFGSYHQRTHKPVTSTHDYEQGGKIERKKWLLMYSIRQQTGLSVEERFRTADDRERFTQIITMLINNVWIPKEESKHQLESSYH